MKALRLLLIGLAVVVFAALGWRLASTPAPQVTTRPPAPTIADGTPAVPAPPQPAPVIAPAAPPVPSAPPPQPAQPVAPSAAQPPEASAAPPPSVAPEANTAPPPPAGLTAQEARQHIDAALAGAPDLAQAFDVLKSLFPADAERSLTAATEVLRTTGTLPSPDELFAGAMRELRLRSGVLAAQAGPEALGAIFDLKSMVLASLEQADPRICADYLFGGTSPEFADFEAGHRALVAKSALATIQAMGDGRVRRMEWGAPTAGDLDAVEAALLAKGLSADEIGALLDGKIPDPPLPDARLCDNAQTYLQVLKALPSDVRNRIYGRVAELLARS